MHPPLRYALNTFQYMHASKHTLLCDTSQGSPRSLIPSIMRRDVFNSLHSLSHPGVKAPRHLVAGRNVWPNIKRDIANWTRTCHDCQQSKIQRHVMAPMQAFTAPDSRFACVHVNIVGPLPPSKGYTYLFTSVDIHADWNRFQ